MKANVESESKQFLNEKAKISARDDIALTHIPLPLATREFPKHRSGDDQLAPQRYLWDGRSYGKLKGRRNVGNGKLRGDRWVAKCHISNGGGDCGQKMKTTNPKIGNYIFGADFYAQRNRPSEEERKFDMMQNFIEIAKVSAGVGIALTLIPSPLAIREFPKHCSGDDQLAPLRYLWDGRSSGKTQLKTKCWEGKIKGGFDERRNAVSPMVAEKGGKTWKQQPPKLIFIISGRVFIPNGIVRGKWNESSIRSKVFAKMQKSPPEMVLR